MTQTLPQMTKARVNNEGISLFPDISIPTNANDLSRGHLKAPASYVKKETTRCFGLVFIFFSSN